jgi:hypothetical protein
MTSVVKWLGALRRSKGSGKLGLPTSPTPRTPRQQNNEGYKSRIPNGLPNGWGAC